jgi:hypothetical protein
MEKLMPSQRVFARGQLILDKVHAKGVSERGAPPLIIGHNAGRNVLARLLFVDNSKRQIMHGIGFAHASQAPETANTLNTESVAHNQPL